MIDEAGIKMVAYQILEDMEPIIFRSLVLRLEEYFEYTGDAERVSDQDEDAIDAIRTLPRLTRESSVTALELCKRATDRKELIPALYARIRRISGVKKGELDCAGLFKWLSENEMKNIKGKVIISKKTPKNVVLWSVRVVRGGRGGVA